MQNLKQICICFRYAYNRQKIAWRIELMKMFVLLIGLLAIPSFAFGYCSEPSELYGKPSAPFCIDNICDSWEVDSYKNEIKSQITKWNNYAEEAIEYAECKNNELINEWNEFVAWNKVRN